MRYPPSVEIDASDLPPSRADRAEVIAVRVLETILGASAERQDVPGAASGLYDLDVTLPDGTVVAVEVTTCIDQKAAEFEAALEDHAVHLDVEGLERSWEVRLVESTRVDGLIDGVAPHLLEMERHGIDGIARPGPFDDEPLACNRQSEHDPNQHPVPVQAIFDLGVDTAWAFDRPDGRESVEFIRRSGGGSGRTERLVTKEVERAATAKDRVRSAPSAHERSSRHLFVCLDPDLCGDVDFGLWSGHPAAAPPPALPSSIDETWVVLWSLTPGEGIGHVVIWHATRGSGWRYPPHHSTAADAPGAGAESRRWAPRGHPLWKPPRRPKPGLLR